MMLPEACSPLDDYRDDLDLEIETMQEKIYELGIEKKVLDDKIAELEVYLDILKDRRLTAEALQYRR